MGTRGLTVVYLDGQHRIAQYGQWDHYPNGQGVTTLEFCRTWLTDPAKRAQFEANLRKCRWVTEAELEETERKTREAMNEPDTGTGMWSMDCANYHRTHFFPLIDRNLGAKVLYAVAEGNVVKEVDRFSSKARAVNTEVDFILQDSLAFAGDSLFCEYAYVVDLDKNVLEVYRGFNQEPVSESSRFAAFRITERYGKPFEYHPVGFWASFPLDNLPDKNTFLEMLDESESEE